MKLHIAMIIITLIGLINTIYLSYNTMQGTPVKCLFFPQEWCDRVTQSRFSKTMGIPNAYLGLAVLSVILILLLLHTKGNMPASYPRFFILFGFLFSLYFFYIQAFVLKAFCTWCVLSALVFMLLFLLQFFL